MKDIMGEAIWDFYNGIRKFKLRVHDSFGAPVVMPTSIYFRDYKQMPKLEKVALSLCSGEIADIGAGAGSHSLFLQEKELQVTAYDISTYNCEVMIKRGVKNVKHMDIFKLEEASYDTLLLLMNGIGLVNDIEGLHRFFQKAHQWIKPKGQIIFDSSDVYYMYEGYPMPPHYYGEIRCCYEYKNQYSDWFNWLYVDYKTVASIAAQYGWQCEKIYKDNQDQYLAKCWKITDAHTTD